MIDIKVNQEKHRIELTIAGHLDTEALVGTEQSMRDSVMGILRQRPDFDLLVCIADAGPAGGETTAKMGDMFGQIVHPRLRKAGHVGFSALATLQMKRITENDPRFQFFTTRREAESWLDE